MPALQLSWVLLLLCLGLAGTVVVYLAVRAARAPEVEPDEPPVEYPAGIRQGHGRVPALLVVLYVGMAVGMVGYVLWAWLARPNY